MRELRKETEIYQLSSYIDKTEFIRNERTPKGDGNNKYSVNSSFVNLVTIRNERTPKGDGNLKTLQDFDRH